jgi:hypothetical protein
MNLTSEQRAEQNRRNAQRSTGPKTVEGKARARTNALKHGLRADALSMPGEDPSLAEARSAAWNEHYQPQSPAAQHLVNECARATLQSDRLAAYQAASVAREAKEARWNWHVQRQKNVSKQVGRLPRRPAAAKEKLESTSAGCRWLIARWEQLQGALEEHGEWKNSEAVAAARLLGGKNANPDAWILRLNAFLIGDRQNVAVFHRLWEAGRQPESLRDSYTLNNLPSPPEARDWLDELIASELAWLRDEEARLRAVDDLPALAEASVLAFVPADPQAARLLLRYQTEARSAFHRAYNALRSTLEHDAESSPNEADCTAPEPEPIDTSPCSTTASAPEPEAVKSAPEPVPDVAKPVVIDAPAVVARWGGPALGFRDSGDRFVVSNGAGREG